MVAMVFLSAWGLLDRRLPRVLRLTLAAAPLVYAAWWGGMWWLSHADRTVAFAGEARLHDGSDISSSRFKIWANVLSLINNTHGGAWATGIQPGLDLDPVSRSAAGLFRPHP